MSARKLVARRPQASADPLGELYAIRAEEAPEPRVRRQTRRVSSDLRTGLVWAALGASSVLVLVVLFG